MHLQKLLQMLTFQRLFQQYTQSHLMMTIVYFTATEIKLA